MNRRWRPVIALSVAALLWCVVIGLLIWFLPLGSSSSGNSSGDVMEDVGRSFASMSALGSVPLIIPTGLAVIAVWSAYRRSRVVLAVTTVLMTAFVILAGFSIGLAYVPAVGALFAASLIAVSASRGQGSASAGQSRAQ